MNYNRIFDWCVRLLEDGAAYFHTTYKAINIWIFVIIEPVVFILMVGIIIRLSLKLKYLKRNIKNKNL